MKNNKPKHTPGPWKVTESNRQSLIIKPTGCLPLAELDLCWCDPNYPEAEMKANANLIAAAPEMLEALKVLVEYAEAHGQMGEVLKETNALKVIAKAEGKRE